jgi:hypothetical protein
MKTINKGLAEKMKADKNDATKPFSNAQNDTAVEINRAGEDKTRNYMGKKSKESRGPDWNKDNEASDGDTSSNAGVFK